MSTAIPYVVGQWVRGERFYGRREQIAEILGGPRNWIWLLGTRRIGKTSLLKQVEHLTAGGDQGYFPLFWDFQGAEDSEGLALDFQDALLDAEDRLAELGIDVEDLGDDLFAALGRLRRQLRSRERTLLLLCDEVEELIQLREKNPALLRKLRRAMQSTEGIRSVLASSIRLWTLAEQREDTSPFLHGFIPPLYIHTLADDEARALVRQTHLEAETRPPLDDATVETIRRRCDNHPYLLQLVAKRYLELEDVEEACEQVAADSMVSYFFSVDFEMLDASEREILHFISAQSRASSKSIESHLAEDSASVSGELQRLENLGFIRREPAHRYVLANFFFRRWLRSSLAASRTSPPAPPMIRQETEVSPPLQGTGISAPAPDAYSAPTLSYEVRFEEIEGRYRLLEEAGKGANGVVYRAYDTVLKTEIALKLLKTAASDAAGLERVRREIVLTRDIRHPNILRIYHLGIDRGMTYLTMEWIDGPSLAQVIADEAPLAAPVALALAVKVASALAAAHRHLVLHRDIKPGNILLDKAREPFLADFGLARLLGTPGLTAEGFFLGTPYYASPEQAELRLLDERSDLYSLALVLFEMLTGKRPFEGESSHEVLEMQRHTPAPDPRQIEPRVPAALAELVLRCLEKDPEERPQSAEVLESELRSLAATLS